MSEWALPLLHALHRDSGAAKRGVGLVCWQVGKLGNLCWPAPLSRFCESMFLLISFFFR